MHLFNKQSEKRFRLLLVIYFISVNSKESSVYIKSPSLQTCVPADYISQLDAGITWDNFTHIYIYLHVE